MSDVGTNGDSLHCHVRPFVDRAREWQKANPEWQLICDMADTEPLYQQWSELPKRERMSWVGKYGESARSAFEEFGTKRCKVEAAVLNADMQLCEAWPMGEAMRVYRTNAPADLPAVAGKVRRDVGLSCAVCGSKKSVDYHSVGNVGISQSLPLCESCKPNAANEPRSEAK